MNIKDLESKSLELRRTIIQSIYDAQSGHPGPSLSWADIGVSLFFDEMKLEGKDKDTFILSKGHAAPGLYSILALKGYIDSNELKNLRQIDSPLQGHPVAGSLPLIDFSTGSLGQGLSLGIGYSLANKVLGNKGKIYVVLGDGEIQKGQVWEAAMSAAKFAKEDKMSGLIAILDNNGFQGDNPIEKTMPSLNPLKEKWESFGWYVQEIDGHNFNEISDAYKKCRKVDDKPSIIIANTVKGKGISYMEKDPLSWHGGTLNKESYTQAMSELEIGK